MSPVKTKAFNKPELQHEEVGKQNQFAQLRTHPTVLRLFYDALPILKFNDSLIGEGVGFVASLFVRREMTSH